MGRRIYKVPQVMQMEALECGAACLCMILAYYGRWIPLEKARVDCGVSRDGSNALNVARAARSYGLEAKGVACSVKRLRKIEGPCILFWNFNHYVVFDGFKGRYAYLNDPARGAVRVTMKEFNDSFTGVAILISRTEAFEPGGTPPSTIAFARRSLKGLGVPILFAAIVAAVGSIIGILNTSIARVFVDNILTTGQNASWIRPLALLMMALALAAGLIQAVEAIYLARIEGKLAVVSSSRFMRHLLHLPAGFYEQRMVGDLQQRQSANETIAYSLVGQLAPQIMNGAMLVLYFVVMLRQSVLLTLVGVSTVVANATLARYISKQRVNFSRTMVTAAGKQYATTVAGIEAIETIKSAGAETGYFKRWAGFQAAANNALTETTSLNAYVGGLPAMFTELANVAVLLLGTWLITKSQLSQGMLLMFQGLLSSFMAPVTGIIGIGQAIQETQTQMERIEDVMRHPVDVPEDSSKKMDQGVRGPLGGDKLRGEVELAGVTFGYSPLEAPLLENLSLHIKPGGWVALVGGSGSGKSTVAKLIAGLYSPWKGEVRLDGMPASEVAPAVLRGSLAVVDQGISVFDDTIADNVRMWDGSIEDFEVILACRDACIHEEVVAREDAYSSRVLPGGRNFSGGQLQRLEIARALACDPTVLILDEATSALDAQTEVEVIDAIRARGLTCIVVAHRLSTIRDCDEIVVLDEGKVVERGTHDELLTMDGAYAKLVRSD
ncbi:MAG: NHLP family bacteriocin export ABC transporter peptidase/permease/ATPase subunit [Atopobiaceae bacterium]|nr:NHLP family bacteriocin export ABC transporter peptidase/permease/ATPase subunit [Atopobiaceae bacterium]